MILTEDELKKADLKGIYERMFRGFYDGLGQIPPVILHRLVCTERANDLDPSGGYLRNMNTINGVFRELEAENENISIFDVSTAPQFIPGVSGNGIFLDDHVHFTPEVNLML